MALEKRKRVEAPDKIMVDRGPISHLIPLQNRNQDQYDNNSPATLADSSANSALQVGARKIELQTDKGTTRLSLSATLNVSNVSISLLSILTLLREDIVVLLMPGYAPMFDARDDFKVLGYSKQDSDGLFFAGGDCMIRASTNSNGYIATVRAMMARQKRETKMTNIVWVCFPKPEIVRCHTYESTMRRVSNRAPAFGSFNTFQRHSCLYHEPVGAFGNGS